MKRSYADCSTCLLFDQTMVRGESNCNDLSEVKILFLAEAPALEEVKVGRPLVGRAGKVYRKAFEDSGLCEKPHYIHNIVMCSNLDENGKTNNPPQEAIDHCSPNVDKLIEKLVNLEYIVLMGGNALKRFGLNNDSISNMRGNFYDWNNKKVFVTFHPSYILRNGGVGSELWNVFFAEFLKLKNELEKKTLKIEEKVENKPYSFDLPDWCYSDEYSLFDIQPMYLDKEVLYIFTHIDGTKKYLTKSLYENYFYISEFSTEKEDHIKEFNKLKLIKNKSKWDFQDYCNFESDVRIEVKRSIDYRFNRKSEEPKIRLKIQFMDIEIYNEGEKRFPKPEIAEKPINAISFKNGNDAGPVYVFILKLPNTFSTEIDEKYINEFIKQNEEDKIEIKVKIFDKEEDLIYGYCDIIKEYDPHIITGWNTDGFDYPYIYNRMKRLNMNIDRLSPLGKTYFNYSDKRPKTFVYGCHLADQLRIFKEYTFSVEPYYKLDYICKKYLGAGKVSLDGTLDNMYVNDINKFIAYSGIDTYRLFELERKFKHMELLNETIKICSTTWDASKTTTGLIDPLILSFAKSKGLVCKNSRFGLKEEKFKGAFVKDPKEGIHEYVIDLDFTSLYPSIIITYNIDTSTYLAKISKDLAKCYIYNRDKFPEQIDIVLDPMKNNEVTNINKKQFFDIIEKNKAIVCINGTVFHGHESKRSFLAECLSSIWDSRDYYKTIMKKSEKGSTDFLVASTRQLVYKVLMNSIYGVLGSSYFRMFQIDLAEAVTLSGQEVSRFAQYHTGRFLKENYNNIDMQFVDKYETTDIPYIIYGDTDSLFITFGEYFKDVRKY